MEELITVQNHGALILQSSYWESDLAQGGKVFCSVNAGAIRILLPPAPPWPLSRSRMSKWLMLRPPLQSGCVNCNPK